MKANFPLKAMFLALSIAYTGATFAADSTSTSSDQTLTTQATTMDQVSSTQDSNKVTTKFASDFATFAGSQENAEAMITGLRNGTPITLSGSTTGTGGTTSSTITPPTKPMGYGETYISMSLAKAQLASYGITEPTADELQAAMTGGTITTSTGETVQLDGVLTQRADGMGWGQIAKADGFKLGRVISAMKSANKSLASTQTTAGTTASTQGKVKTSSYASKSDSHVRHSSSYSYDRGITTAMGGSGVVYGKSHGRSDSEVASLNSHGSSGYSHGQGAGISTAAGGASVVHGNAGGNSGNAPGQGKGPK